MLILGHKIGFNKNSKACESLPFANNAVCFWQPVSTSSSDRGQKIEKILRPVVNRAIARVMNGSHGVSALSPWPLI